MAEQVNHPSHYNQHPAGIECIDVIRHYTCDVANALKYLWRAGLKPELGKEDAEKEIEDLQKALWYIEDYQQNASGLHCAEAKSELMQVYVEKITGHSIIDITRGYTGDVALAIGQLLQIGLVVNGVVHTQYRWPVILDDCKKCIHGRIDKIYCDASDKNLDEIRQIFRGELVEGMGYAKPGGEREDEPDDYDPLNIIIQAGNAYCLSDKTKQKPNGAMYNPCELCALRHECDDTGTNSPCELLYARNNQYLREVGRVKYNRHFGTISVTDEMKELEIENRKLEEELKRDGK